MGVGSIGHLCRFRAYRNHRPPDNDRYVAHAPDNPKKVNGFSLWLVVPELTVGRQTRFVYEGKLHSSTLSDYSI